MTKKWQEVLLIVELKNGVVICFVEIVWTSRKQLYTSATETIFWFCSAFQCNTDIVGVRFT